MAHRWQEIQPHTRAEIRRYASGFHTELTEAEVDEFSAVIENRSSLTLS